MSKAQGEKKIKELLEKALAKSKAYQSLQEDFREKLNTSNLHILDISKKALEENATPENISKFPDSYNKFINKVAEANLKATYTTLAELKSSNPDIPKGSQVIYVQNPPLLICASFKAARIFVTTELSKKMPNDEFFGISNRARTKTELEAEGAIIVEVNLQDPAYTGLVANPADQTNFLNYANTKMWRLATRKDGKYSKNDRFFNSAGNELDPKDLSKEYIRELSLVDLGHLYTRSVKDAPLGFKINNLLKFKSLSSELRKVVEDALEELVPHSALVQAEYQNELPQRFRRAGILTLTLEFYKRNGKKSKFESSIFSKVKTAILKDIEQGIRDKVGIIPGSNTMIEDFAALLRQDIEAKLTGKPNTKKLPKHPVLTTGVLDKQKPLKLNANSQVLTSGSKQTKARLPVIRNTRGQFTSLASLQTLLNLALAQQIQKNMGTGTSKNILNYRTGRLAESAEVTGMSQSREGMLTAYYTYMKYPYQTFEPGYAQGSPRTRDPKLLISKSIREVLSTQVNNRLRAVLA